MNTLLIVGIIIFIVVIALVAYFMLGKSSQQSLSSQPSCREDIDGTYSNNPDELKVYIGQGKVLILQKTAKQSGDFIMAPIAEFQTAQVNDPIYIDNKPIRVYRSAIPIFGKYIFLAKNPTSCSISFYKMGATSYERLLPDFPVDLKQI